MARVTIEDCLDHVENRFHLVLKATKRARQLSLGGAEATLPWENDKPTVMALREIAGGNLVEQTQVQAQVEAEVQVQVQIQAQENTEAAKE